MVSGTPLEVGYWDGLLSRQGSAERMPGFARARPESIRRPAFTPRFLEDCRRARLRMDLPAHRSTVLAVVSGERGEGRSSIAAGMAWLAAEDGDAPVLLADLDLANPGLAELFGVGPSPGLADHSGGFAPLRVVSGGPAGRLHLLPAGTRPANGEDVRRHLRLTQMLRACRESFGTTVLDLPPLLDSPEAVRLAGEADFALVIGRYGRTTLASVERVLALLEGPCTPAFMLAAQASRIPRWLMRLL